MTMLASGNADAYQNKPQNMTFASSAPEVHQISGALLFTGLL